MARDELDMSKSINEAFIKIILKQDTKSVKNFITAMFRGSLMMMDNLGIAVKSEEAMERYARYIDKPLDELDYVDHCMAVGLEGWRLLMEVERELILVRRAIAGPGSPGGP